MSAPFASLLSGPRNQQMPELPFALVVLKEQSCCVLAMSSVMTCIHETKLVLEQTLPLFVISIYSVISSQFGSSETATINLIHVLDGCWRSTPSKFGAMSPGRDKNYYPGLLSFTQVIAVGNVRFARKKPHTCLSLCVYSIARCVIMGLIKSHMSVK